MSAIRSSLQTVTEWLRFHNNPNLASLEGLENLTYVGELMSISGTELLENVDELGALTTVEGDLYIHHNDALVGVDGLGNLVAVEDLHIADNQALVSISGLSSLTTVSDTSFYIVGNPLLPDCDVCGVFGQLTTTPSFVSIYDNLDDSCTPAPDNCL